MDIEEGVFQIGAVLPDSSGKTVQRRMALFLYALLQKFPRHTAERQGVGGLNRISGMRQVFEKVRGKVCRIFMNVQGRPAERKVFLKQLFKSVYQL